MKEVHYKRRPLDGGEPENLKILTMTKQVDQTVKNMAMNILYRERLDSAALLKDFFIVDAEGQRDGRFNMQNTIDYISAY